MKPVAVLMDASSKLSSILRRTTLHPSELPATLAGAHSRAALRTCTKTHLLGCHALTYHIHRTACTTRCATSRTSRTHALDMSHIHALALHMQ